MVDISVMQHVETEGWDLTEEQLAIINTINGYKAVMRRAWSTTKICMILILAFTFGMMILQEDQTSIFETYRLCFMVVACIGFRSLMDFHMTHFKFTVDHAKLMRTHPPLPGSADYVEEQTEGESK